MVRIFDDAAHNGTHIEHPFIEDFPSTERIEHCLDRSVVSKEIVSADICVLRKAVEASRHKRQWRRLRKLVEDELKDFIFIEYIKSIVRTIMQVRYAHRRTTETFHDIWVGCVPCGEQEAQVLGLRGAEQRLKRVF
jgi:hypothetical protein